MALRRLPIGRRPFIGLLLLLAAWTLILEFAVPAHSGARDGWWVAELALAGLLLRPGPFAWGIAVATSAAALLVHALRVATILCGATRTAPEPHGFVHACAVLAVFTALAGWLVTDPEARRLKNAP